MLVFEERGEPEHREKNLSGRGENQNKLKAYMASLPGYEHGPDIGRKKIKTRFSVLTTQLK